MQALIRIALVAIAFGSTSCAELVAPANRARYQELEAREERLEELIDQLHQSRNDAEAAAELITAESEAKGVPLPAVVQTNEQWVRQLAERLRESQAELIAVKRERVELENSGLLEAVDPVSRYFGPTGFLAFGVLGEFLRRRLKNVEGHINGPSRSAPVVERHEKEIHDTRVEVAELRGLIQPQPLPPAIYYPDPRTDPRFAPQPSGPREAMGVPENWSGQTTDPGPNYFSSNQTNSRPPGAANLSSAGSGSATGRPSTSQPPNLKPRA